MHCTYIQNEDVESGTANKRDNWGNGLEFLMSCIALSVGLGNVWRFPFIALDNGGKDSCWVACVRHIVKSLNFRWSFCDSVHHRFVSGWTAYLLFGDGRWSVFQP